VETSISLNDILGKLLKERKLIISIIIVALLIGVFYSFVVVKPIYEVTSFLIVDNKSATDDKKYKNNISYVEQVQSSATLKGIIKELNINDYDINQLRKNLIITSDNDNLIKVKFKGNNPTLVTNVANKIIYKIGSLIEISDRMLSSVENKKKLIDIEDNLAVVDKEINQITNQLNQNPEKLITKKSLADDLYLQSAVAEVKGLNLKELGSIQLTSEEINGVYTSLKMKLAEASIYQTKLQAEKSTLTNRIKENDSLIQSLADTTNANDNNNQEFIRQITEFKAVSINIGLEPDEPVGPNKKLYIAFSFVVGLCIAILAALIKPYIINNKHKHEEKKINVSN